MDEINVEVTAARKHIKISSINKEQHNDRDYKSELAEDLGDELKPNKETLEFQNREAFCKDNK